MKRFSFIRGRRFSKDERGGALAELAILVPFLIILMAAVTELGRLFQAYTSLSKSTRAAARYLSNNSYEELYINRAKQIALCGKIACSGGDEVVSGLTVENIEVKANPEAGAGNPTSVTLSIKDYTFQPIFNLPALMNMERSFSFSVAPSTTMYYMWIDPAGAEE